MFKFTRNSITLSIATIVFCVIPIIMYQYSKGIETNIETNIMEEREDVIFENVQTEEQSIWQIEIPKISLTANIVEGTTAEILNKNIGHFEETQKEKGNIALAAHNRGYEVNYFQDLKLLQEGDEIKYKYNQYENTYVVTKNKIIKDTDICVLENTEENMMTLITCVENEPNYRRCVQAIEKEEEE